MQAAELLKYINDPALLNKQSVKDLQKLVHDFPYFQSAHLLLSIASKKWDTSVYQNSLKKTAIIATNRAHLFHMIHQLESEDNDGNENVLIVDTKSVAASDTFQEDSKQELDILKATEVSEEVAASKEMASAEKTKEEKLILSAEQILEQEIGNQLVNAFVEKEILKTPEANRQKPVLDEPENFGDWLSFLKKNNGQSYEDIDKKVKREKAKTEFTVETTPEKPEKSPIESRKLKNKAIIDKIIESSPGLIRHKEEQKFYAPDIKAKESLLENEHLVTETLARIYALQGNVNKAVRAYEILSLKFPQKSAYFATLIEKLKNN